MKRQRGTHTVEFALVGWLFIALLFVAIEIGRALFVWNVLTEATRRGARLAAVCPITDTSVANVTVFNSPGNADSSPVLPNLEPGDVDVRYFNAAGAETADRAVAETVRVTISGYRHALLIPYFLQELAAPDFATTLPRESLGMVCASDGTCGYSAECPAD